MIKRIHIILLIILICFCIGGCKGKFDSEFLVGTWNVDSLNKNSMYKDYVIKILSPSNVKESNSISGNLIFKDDKDNLGDGEYNYSIISHKLKLLLKYNSGDKTETITLNLEKEENRFYFESKDSSIKLEKTNNQSTLNKKYSDEEIEEILDNYYCAYRAGGISEGSTKEYQYYTNETMKEEIAYVIVDSDNGEVWESCDGKVIREYNIEDILDDNNHSIQTSNNIQGSIVDCIYLDRDELFLLKTENGNSIFVDLDGNIKNNVDLNSHYLKYDDGYIYDIEGNDMQDKFIKDTDHEQILGICRMDSQDVVWLRENQETPSSSLIIIKAYDENGKELCRIDSNNEYLKQNDPYAINNFKYISSVEYAGDCVCRIRIRYTNKDALFSVNVETGEILNPQGEFSDGYAVISAQNNKGIQDVHGNYLVGPTSTNDILYETSYYNDGLFLSKTQKKFYDIHMNVKIDLSEYDILFWEGNTGTPGWQEEYAFKDGYCGIEVQNENGTRFYGVLDTNGKWIIELTDTLASNSDGYSGKVTETKIKMGQRLYDIESHEFMNIPTDVSDNRKLVKGKYYFVNDKNEFWWYNPDTGEIKPLSLTVG